MKSIDRASGGMNHCTTHHICDCHKAKLSKLQKVVYEIIGVLEDREYSHAEIVSRIRYMIELYREDKK